MVKVFLCESSNDCFSRLQELMVTNPSCCILLPDNYFRICFSYFYPQIDSNLLFTPTTLLQTLKVETISQFVAHVFNDYTGNIDPSLFCLTSENYKDICRGKDLGFLSVDLAHKKDEFLFEACVLYGPFTQNILPVLLERLGTIFKSIFVIKRDFKVKLADALEGIKSYHVDNNIEEKLWIQKRLNVCKKIPFVSHYIDTFIPLFQEKVHTEISKWLGWQEACTLGSFLIYLRGVIKENRLFESYKKDLKDAYMQCLMDDFCILQRYLIEQDKIWIKDFTYIEWPLSANFCDYILLFKQTLCGSSISEEDYPYLEEISIPYTKNQFFTYLRKVFNIRNFSGNKILLKWEQAIYLPITSCYIVHALRDKINDKNLLSWFDELTNMKGMVEVCAPIRDEKGIAQKPLLEPNGKEDFYNEFAKGKIEQSNNFVLPKERIKFSCKAWERFYLCPRRTWLDTVIKVDTIALEIPCLKAKVLGEWVHDNLQFEEQPKTLQDWHASIEANAALRWQFIKEQLQAALPYVFTQWHQRALTLSHKMANACEDLLDGSWQLFSEYSLPKNSKFTGRIDLLATKESRAVIVDYKTAVYSFTKQQISRGHGLQLLLYGRQLQSVYEDISLRIVDKNGNNSILNLSELSEATQVIETWMRKFIQTGLYEPLPEEKPETLPLCW